MKPLLSATLLALGLTFPAPAQAESYAVGVLRIQMPKIQRAMRLAKSAYELGDLETGCSMESTAILLIEMNLAGLDELDPEGEWVKTLHNYRKSHKDVCGSAL